MTQTKAKKTNTQWYPYDEFGSYFKLEDDALLQCPMNVDGSKDVSVCEVDWEMGVGEEDMIRLKEIVEELQFKA